VQEQDVEALFSAEEWEDLVQDFSDPTA